MSNTDEKAGARIETPSEWTPDERFRKNGQYVRLEDYDAQTKLLAAKTEELVQAHAALDAAGVAKGAFGSSVRYRIGGLIERAESAELSLSRAREETRAACAHEAEIWDSEPLSGKSIAECIRALALPGQDEEDSYDCPIHGTGKGTICPRC